ncbi:hypothetical protein B7P43_G14929 [Cryptotermes secundus]|uniref:Uncharacterized protein n=1 Tax=Cryptotermes secundus TaxID=105785 RepID=A0A2J7QK84_9NEOP|nr:hypothetical protein B7P43_G14929 [Cryptotermes secundus]
MNQKMGDFLDFERGQIIGGASVTKTAAQLDVSRVTVYKIVSLHESLEDHISEEEKGMKINTGRKRLPYIEKDCSKKKKTLTTAAQVDRTAELNIHLEDCLHEAVQHELQKSDIHGKAATAKPLITETNIQMCKRCCHDHKTWTSDKWKRASYGQMSFSSRCSLHQEEFTFGEHPRKPIIRNVPTVKHWVGSIMVRLALL